MSKVKTKPLGSIISVSKGKKHIIADTPSISSKRLLGIDDLRNDNLLRFTNDPSGTAVLPNDVLIAWDGANAGTVGYGKSGYIGSTIARLRINEKEKFFTPFLGTFLKSKFDYFRQTATGATIPHINRKAFDSIQLPDIDFQDQIRIAHLLGKVEDLINQRKQNLQQLDDLLKSVFLEMFGDPVRNERRWETKALGQIATIERGRFSPRPRNDPKFYNGLYPFIQTGDITRSNGRLKKYTQTLNEHGIKVSKEFNIGTIVIAIVGATIGETAVLEIPTYAPDSVIGITPKKDVNQTESVFIEFILRFWKPVIRARAPEAARANINIETLRPLPIIWPKEVDRKRFSQIFQKVESIKSHYHQNLADLETLYGALSQKAFQGELDLSRVPMPIMPQEKPIGNNASLSQDIKLEINLPDSDLLSDALRDRTLLKNILHEWLPIYLSQLNENTFSAEKFMHTAKIRIAELYPENDFEFRLNDYDHIKAWVFNQIKSGMLKQTRNVISVNEKRQFGNKINLRVRKTKI